MSSSPSPSVVVAMQPPKAWWQFPLVWMIIAGPAAVVLASLVTVILTFKQPDPLLAEDYYQRGLNINKTMAAQQANNAMAPAALARNHAATGVAARK